MLKRILFVLFSVSCCFSTVVYGQDQYSLGGFNSPASVTQYGGFFYLSNSGNNYGTAIADGDGFISRVRSDGSQQEPTMSFITGLNNPRGILAIQNILYVCDINRLVGFDLRTQRRVFELSFESENVTQLTGIASVNDRTVYLTATDINAIFEVDLTTGQYVKWTETTAPTGILIENNQMYVCSFGTDSLPNGKLGVIDMRTKTFTQLTDDEGHLYGLSLDGRRLYYSDWMQLAGRRGIIKWINIDTRATGQVNFTTRIGGPADFHYDARNDLFLIPSVLEGVVHGCMGFIRR